MFLARKANRSDVMEHTSVGRMVHTYMYNILSDSTTEKLTTQQNIIIVNWGYLGHGGYLGH